MKRRFFLFLLAFALLLGLLPATASAAPTLEEAMREVSVYAKHDVLNWLTMNGAVKDQRYTYYNYVSVQTGEAKEIPAYCVDPRLKGVPILTPEGTPIRYSSDTTVQDPKVCGIIANGYPHHTLESLGLQTVYEAYYATKTALWTYLLSNWSIDKLGINPDLTGVDREAAERVMEAAKNIYWRGMAWTHLVEPRLTAAADKDTAYPVTINGERYYQQIITITSETWSYETVKLSLPASAPAGTKILSMDNEEIDRLELTTVMADNQGFQGQCKIVYPASVQGQTGTVQLEMRGVAVQYKIFYAKSLEQDAYGNIQDYMLDTDPSTEVSGSFVSRYAADDTEDGDPPGGDTGLKIVKLEKGTRTPLEGAVFKVTAPDGTIVGRFSSGQDGTVTIPLSITGHYTVEEETAPRWHLLDENSTQHVTVKHGETATVTFVNAPYGSLQVRKVDADTGANLNGANIQIKNAETGAVFSADTAAGGIATFEKLEPGTYEVTELTAPEGYVLNSKIENVVVNTGELATVTLKNSARPGLRVIKYDSKTMTLLPGAAFEISRDGMSLGRFTTDEQGMIELLDAQPGTYLVREVQVDGSHIADPTPQQIELSAGDGIRELIFYNAQKPGVHILKVDSANPSLPLSGAVFEIKSVGGAFHEERKTEGDGTIDLSGLEPGAYTIQEKKAPDGYLLNDAVRTIRIEDNQDQSFVFTNTILPSLQIVKTSADGSRLKGVTFRIARIEDGSRYLDRITDEQGEILISDLEPGVYSVKETATDASHVLDVREYHVELFPGKTSALAIENQVRPNLTVWKHDADTGEPIPNTVFQVRAADGHSVDEIKTDSEGKATLSNLLPGVYEISEKSVPSAYLLDAPSQLVTLYPNRDHNVYFENHKKPSLTVMKVDSASGDVIKGAEFHFWYGSNNTTTGELNDLGTYQTNAEGLVRLTGLRDGWYQVTETAPAKGYAIKEPGEQSVFLRGGESRELVFENIPLSAIVVWKFDSVTKTAITGAEFQVRYLGGTSGTGGTVIGSYKTGVNGAFTVTGLKGGTYVVEEVSSDANHVIDTAPQTVLITGQDQDVVQVYFGNTPKGSVLIRKIDVLTHEPLSGVEFTVTDSTGAVIGTNNGKFTTDSTGSFLVENLDPGVTLVVRESRAKDGYILDETPQTVQVKPGKTVKLEFANLPKSSLLIVKKDAATGKPLSGVEFLVTAADGTYIGPDNGKYTTDSAGTILIHGLTPGTAVVVRETHAKNGYLMDNAPQTVTIQAGRTAALEFRNKPLGSLVIHKYSSMDRKTPLAGVQFKVTYGSGCVVDNENGKLSSNGIYYTGSDGTIRIDGIVGTVVVTEQATIPGYTIDPETRSQTVVVNPDDTQELYFYNTPKNVLIIEKYIEEEGSENKPLEGVTFLVTDSSGAVVGNSSGEFVTGEDGRIVIAGVEPGMTIQAREIKVPDGVFLDGMPKTIKISGDSANILRFYNKKTGYLVIRKLDKITKQPLANVEFELTYADGSYVDDAYGHLSSKGRFKTNDAGEIRVPVVGTVVVKEVKTLSTHVIDEATRIQTVTVNPADTQTLVFYNEPLCSLMISKKDAITGKPVPNTEFVLKDGDGNLLGRCTTGSDGTATVTGLTPNSTVVVVESKVPSNYVLDPTPRTIIVKNGTGNSVSTGTASGGSTSVGGNNITVENVPKVTLTIEKYLETESGEKPLKGVTFLVTDQTGAVVGGSNGEYTTDENGRIVISNLEPGTTVTAREVSVPDGVVLDSTPKSILIKAGEQGQTLRFVNKKAGGLELIKVSESDKSKRIPNTTFEIRKMDGGLVTTVTTGSQGRVYVNLDAGDYCAVETAAAEGFKLDATPHYFTVEDGRTTTLTVTNKVFSGILLHKIDSTTKKGIYGVTFLLYDSAKTPIGQYTTDDRGYVYIEGLTKSGRYYLRELENEGYVPDTQMKTVYVTAGETTLVEWENIPITAQIQITKRSADYNSTNGLPAGTLLEGAVFEIYDRANNLVDIIRSDRRGLAVSKPLPLGRYTIREIRAPVNYGVSDTVLNAYLEHEGQIVRFEVTNKSLTTGVSITKTGPKEAMAGQPVRYTFASIANSSNVRLDNFYWRDVLPAEVRLNTVVTGTYNFPGAYKITYRVNGGEYRTLADNLSTSRNYTLAASPAALGLAANERVTEIMFVFGQVPAGFAQVEKPQIKCTAVTGLAAGSSFVNIADVGGTCNGVWVQAVSRWETKVYGKPTLLPRTGY